MAKVTIVQKVQHMRAKHAQCTYVLVILVRDAIVNVKIALVIQYVVGNKE